MLINSIAYKDGKRHKDVAINAISEYLAQESGFVWVALFNPEPVEIIALQEQFKLHPLAVEDVLNGQQRPKLEEYNNGVFIVIPAYETSTATPAEWDSGEVHVFAGSNYVLSVRRNYSRGFQDVRERCEREPQLLKLGPGFVVYALLDSMVDRYFPFVNEIEDELESIEERIFQQDKPQDSIMDLYALKHKVITLKHSTSALLEAMAKLHGGRVPQMCVSVQDYFRDVIDHLERINAAIENTREMLITAIHVNLTLVSINDSKVTKRLAAWAAILAVPTMIAGIYGMNFRFMPEIDWPWGYPLSLVLMLIIDIILYIRFKRADWI